MHKEFSITASDTLGILVRLYVVPGALRNYFLLKQEIVFFPWDIKVTQTCVVMICCFKVDPGNRHDLKLQPVANKEVSQRKTDFFICYSGSFCLA